MIAFLRCFLMSIAAVMSAMAACSAYAALPNHPMPLVGVARQYTGTITVSWAHNDDSVYAFVVELDSPDNFRWVARTQRLFVLAGVSDQRAYRVRVCAVYAFDRTCSDEAGVGWTPVAALGAKPPVPVSPPAPQPLALPQPVVRAALTRRDPSGPLIVHLTWVNPVDPVQWNMLQSIMWYRHVPALGRNEAIGDIRLKEIDDPRTDSAATVGYFVCIRNAVTPQACSMPVYVAPVNQPLACRPGFVWREARATDRVCVVPAARARVAEENRVAAANVQPGGGAYGPNTCRVGFVWREAFGGDVACVTPASRSLAAQENQSAAATRADGVLDGSILPSTPVLRSGSSSAGKRALGL